MRTGAFIILMVAALFLFGDISKGGNPPMLPAPADRTKFKYKRTPGGLKLNKYGLIDPSPDVISLKHLPKDKYGFVDWAKAIRDGIIAPKGALPGGREKEPEFNGDIIIKSKMDFMPDVLFPHSVHNQWLNCNPCHPKMFEKKAGATPISMIAIWKGRYCGRCHDKVAFPIRNCFKCHSVKRK